MSEKSEILQTLLNSRCSEISPKDKPLIIPSIESNISHLDGWEVPLNYAELKKRFQFKNYYQTVAFVNAVTWLAQKEGHHPTVCFGYNHCDISLSTHDIKGLSMNDMIMAAKINALLED
ncbi:4a-hydroxytetrahydrobiopterin dehydratase [Thiomicrorhabdus xiamenensis]|uniref:Putative pterin-4-alpha-carbinolamine dehydratase n=1 Tax=Thiomicrorhabdus xiamenensis TaxID=2739063 RepID=A0A7D4NXU6_9GAMM|nr:4a-hydroxytetrahydrobiopterin dehydratase [Thiomicrorhabdus xiamenensis]QKI88778.1 4a-hydroxytetrahydrobiopterin dehydratase [Thiomicrorhabdus xiamenensis]